MKRIVLILISVLTICLAAGCGSAAPGGSADGGSAGGTVDLESIKTLGDAFAIEGKDEYGEQKATYEGKYFYVFTVDGVNYRVIADLPDDVAEQMMALEFDDNYDANEQKLLSDIPVSQVEDLSEQILSQEELIALEGKTGQELFDAGWRPGSFYNTETLEVWLEYGPYSYNMHFDGKARSEDPDDFDFYTDLADKKLIEASFEGLGDATILE